VRLVERGRELSCGHVRTRVLGLMRLRKPPGWLPSMLLLLESCDVDAGGPDVSIAFKFCRWVCDHDRFALDTLEVLRVVSAYVRRSATAVPVLCEALRTLQGSFFSLIPTGKRLRLHHSAGGP